MTRATAGFTAADLIALRREALAIAARRCSAAQPAAPLPRSSGAFRPLAADWRRALGNVCASPLRPQRSSGRGLERLGWSDVGGLPHLVERLTRAVTRPLEHPEALARLGLTPARGVLLHGPPGCSKTTIVRAVAGTTRASFHYLSGAEIYSPFVGEAERAIRAFFDLGRATAPSLLFLDEIDALVGKRDGAGGGGGDSVQLRVLSTLLNEMDGVEPLNQVAPRVSWETAETQPSCTPVPARLGGAAWRH